MEDQAEEGGGPAFGLAEAGHEQGAEGDQSRPRLAGGNADGQVAAGGAAAVADESMALIFGNEGLDVGQFPDLMTERFGIDAGQGLAATSARLRHTAHDGLALLHGDQSPLVLDMAKLTPGRAPRFGFASGRFGVWVFRRGRLGRVGGVFAKSRFQLGHLRRQDANLLGLPLQHGHDGPRQRGQDVR